MVTESRFRWFVAARPAGRCRGRPATALGQLDQAEQLYRPGFLPDVRPIPAIRARIRIVARASSSGPPTGRGTEACRPADAASYLSEFDHLTLVRLLLAQQRGAAGRRTPPLLDQAVGLLDRLREAAG